MEAPLEQAQQPAAASPLPENRLIRLPITMKQSAQDLAQSIDCAAEAGFKGIVVPLALGGLPLFPSPTPKSNHLKPSLPFFKERDVLEEVCARAETANVRVYATFNPWRPTGDIPADRVRRWFHHRHEWFSSPPRWRGYRHVSPAVRGFCPTQDELRRYWGDLLIEAVEGYPLTGVTIEMTEPPFTLRKGRERCFCAECKAYAKSRFDLDLSAFLDNLHREEMLKAWRAMQADRVQNWVAYLCQRCHKSRRGVLLRMRVNSAREPQSPSRPDAQDIDAPPEHLIRPLLAQGMLEGIEFNNIHLDDDELEDLLQLNLAIWPDDTLLYPAFLARNCEELARHLPGLRQMPFIGFEVDWVGQFSAEAAADLKANCLAEPAFPAENTPMESVARLFQEISRLAPQDSGVPEFLSDMLNFARSPSATTPLAALDSLVQNLRGLEARLLQGQVDFGESAGLALCRLSQAKRLARLASHNVGI